MRVRGHALAIVVAIAILENGRVEYYIDTSFMAETIRCETRYSLLNC